MSDAAVHPKQSAPHTSVGYFFPLLAIVVAAYAVLVLSVGPHHVIKFLDRSMFSLPIAAKETMLFCVRDAFVLTIFVLLFCETLKAAQRENRALINHGLSLIVAAICTYTLLSLDGYGTTTFFYITVATVFDVVAGLWITWRAAPLHESPIVVTVKRA